MILVDLQRSFQLQQMFPGRLSRKHQHTHVSLLQLTTQENRASAQLLFSNVASDLMTVAHVAMTWWLQFEYKTAGKRLKQHYTLLHYYRCCDNEA